MSLLATLNQQYRLLSSVQMLVYNARYQPVSSFLHCFVMLDETFGIFNSQRLCRWQAYSCKCWFLFQPESQTQIFNEMLIFRKELRHKFWTQAFQFFHNFSSQRIDTMQVWLIIIFLVPTTLSTKSFVSLARCPHFHQLGTCGFNSVFTLFRSITLLFVNMGLLFFMAYLAILERHTRVPTRRKNSFRYK